MRNESIQIRQKRVQHVNTFVFFGKCSCTSMYSIDQSIILLIMRIEITHQGENELTIAVEANSNSGQPLLLRPIAILANVTGQGPGDNYKNVTQAI